LASRRAHPPHPKETRIATVVSAAVAGLGIIHLFEEWLRPYLDSGALEPVLAPWWQSFSGPFLYYPGRRHLPTPLRAFVDFIKT
jgi:DNA-binding transcriptional LysR family regulator